MKRRRFMQLSGQIALAAGTLGAPAIIRSRPGRTAENERRPNDGRPVRFIRPFRREGYGSGNGRSYANAFNGIENAELIAGGVHYFCGVFLPDWDGRSAIAEKYLISIPSGRAEARTELRGDWPDAPGILVGGVRPTWGPWQDEGAGVYSLDIRAGFGNFWYFEGTSPTSEGRPLAAAESLADCRERPGTQWSDSYDQFRGSRRIFLHLSDGSRPDGNVLFGRYGWRFDYGGSREYIDMIGLDLRVVSIDTPLGAGPRHCRWVRSSFKYGESRIFGIWGAAQDIHWDGCTLSRAGNGIYLIASEPEHGIAEDYSIRNCTILDIGTDPQLTNGDDHAIGIQGSRLGVISGNRIERCGWHIMIYAFDQHEPNYHGGVWTQPMEDIVIENNDISQWNGNNASEGVGIAVSGDRSHQGSKTGLVIRHNRLRDLRLGIRVKSDINVVVESNTIFDCRQGIRVMGMLPGLAATLRQNVVDGVSDYFVALGRHRTSYYVGQENRFVLKPGQNPDDRLFRYGNDPLNLQEWRRYLRILGNDSDPDTTSTLVQDSR